MGSSHSRDNPVTEVDTKAQDGQKDGSVAADPKVRRKRPKRTRTVPEVSDDSLADHHCAGPIGAGDGMSGGNNAPPPGSTEAQAMGCNCKPRDGEGGYRAGRKVWHRTDPARCAMEP